jgi:hypothetical protein
MGSRATWLLPFKSDLSVDFASPLIPAVKRNARH